MAACPSWSPWEKLSRATFMPASTRAPRVSTLQQAGPRVQMILHFLRDSSHSVKILSWLEDGEAAAAAAAAAAAVVVSCGINKQNRRNRRKHGDGGHHTIKMGVDSMCMHSTYQQQQQQQQQQLQLQNAIYCRKEVSCSQAVFHEQKEE